MIYNPLEQYEDKAYDCFTVSQSQGTGLDSLHHDIYSHPWWTNQQ